VNLAHPFYLDPMPQNADPNESVSANQEPPRGGLRNKPDLFCFKISEIVL
jgi:hypothetical protein